MSSMGIVFIVIIIFVSTQSYSISRTKYPLLVNELKALKKCTDDVGSRIVIPGNLRFSHNNKSSNTLEHLSQDLGDPLFEFSLVTKEPSCKSGTFNVTVIIGNNGTNSIDVDEETKELSFTAEVAVSYRVENSLSAKHIIYHRENYCISSMTEKEISLKLCKSQCFAHDEEAGDNLCVSRCCPPGKMSSVQNSKIQGGCASSDGTDWYPQIYADGNFTTPELQVYPQIVVNDNNMLEEWNCTYEDQMEVPILKSEIRFLTDGRILRKIHRVWSFDWKNIQSDTAPVAYCVDGYQDPLRPLLNDTMIVLKKCYTQSEIRESDEILKSNEQLLLQLKLLIFLVHLPSAVTYLLITIIYLSIWDKHHARGWIILGFSTSQLIYFIFYTTAYSLLAFTSYFESIFTPQNPYCYLIGFFQNFTDIVHYSWTVVITFDLWKTISSFQLESSQSKGKRIALYYSFALGIPAFVVFAVAVPMEYLTDGWNVVTPGFRQKCVIAFGLPYYLYIITPNIILYIPNLVFAGLTFRTLRVAKSNAKHMKTSKKRETIGNQATQMAKLLSVMGFSLFFEISVQLITRFVGYSRFFQLLKGFKLLQAIVLFWTFVCGEKTQEHLGEKFPILFKIFKRIASTENESGSEIGTGVTMSPPSKISHENTQHD